MTKIFLSVCVAALIVGGAIALSQRGADQGGGKGTASVSVPQKTVQSAEPKNNVSTVGDRQVIEIRAKGGYAPRETVARAGVPTVIRVTTQGTFDCSSALTIPAIGYDAVLPRSGITDIDVPAQKPGTTLQGLCSMGMYNFQVRFE